MENISSSNANVWKKCSTCKNPIAHGGKYYVCSVSSCNGQRTGYVFCQMTCFEAHVPGARHRDAGAISQVAPNRFIAKSQPTVSSAAATPASSSFTKVPQEVLIIASRLKDYIQAKGDMNTSASVMDVLSDYLRILCERAMDNARADGRKTVMDRDFEFLKDRR